MATNFNLYSKYYDLMYHDKDYSSEVNYVIKSLLDSKKNITEILELGCGSGAHAKYFSEKGFSITGLDRSEEMIFEAKKKNIPNFEPIIADISNFELYKKFDAVISMFHVVSYLTENNDLLSCFKNANTHLENDGIFLFDCWFTPAVYAIKPENRIKEFENDEIKVHRTAQSTLDILKNTVSVKFNISIEDKSNHESENLSETHLMRHFSIPEMEIIAQNSGFKILKVEELITKADPSLETWAVCFILQKVKSL